MGTFYNPPPQPFLGGRQPYEPRKLPAILLDAWPGNRTGQTWVITDDKNDQLWTTFRRRLPPSILNLSPDNPQFAHRGRWRSTIATIRISDPPPPNPFIGGRQPLAPRRLNPTVLNLAADNPRFGHRMRTAAYMAIVYYDWITPLQPPFPPYIPPPGPPTPPSGGGSFHVWGGPPSGVSWGNRGVSAPHTRVNEPYGVKRRTDYPDS